MSDLNALRSPENLRSACRWIAHRLNAFQGVEPVQ